MEIIRWGNRKGYTLALTGQEAQDLLAKLPRAIKVGHCDGEHLDIEIEVEKPGELT